MEVSLVEFSEKFWRNSWYNSWCNLIMFLKSLKQFPEKNLVKSKLEDFLLKPALLHITWRCLNPPQKYGIIQIELK